MNNETVRWVKIAAGLMALGFALVVFSVASDKLQGYVFNKAQ